MESLINYLENLSDKISKAEINFKKSPKDRLCKEYIEGRLEMLEQLWLEYTHAHKDLMIKNMPEKVDTTNYIQKDVYESTSEVYLGYKCLLKKSLANYVHNSNSSDSGEVGDGKGQCVGALIKLPKINISTFSGKYTEWPTFRDMFRSMIHNNNTLEDVQKLHYLKGYVTGDAEQLLRHIKITHDNYDRCWRLLEQTYDNKRYISNHVLNTLFGLKPIVKESSAALKEIINTTNDCLADLSGLGIDVASWDIIIIYLLVQKLDPESKRQWEFNYTKENSSTELPTYSQFKEFVANRYRAIECLESGSNVDKVVHKLKALHVTQQLSCQFCSEEHKLSSCDRFMNESVDTRRNFVQNHYICFNCLGSGHTAKQCRVKFRCKLCNSKHHTTLHPVTDAESKSVEKSDVVLSGEVVNSSGSAAATTVSVSSFSCVEENQVCGQVLLPTALVNAQSRSGEKYVIRALLDQASQTSLVTESMVQYLGLRKIAVGGQITGVGGENEISVKSKVEIKFSSLINPSCEYTVEAYVMRSITSLLPSGKVAAYQWADLDNIPLADPNYHTPNHIDMLLSSKMCCKVLQSGFKKHPSGELIAQATTLGWIISGEADATSAVKCLTSMHCTAREVDNEMLRRFWEIEADVDPPKEKILTAEEMLCEQIYQETTKRNEDGRYVVRLPFREKKPWVENSLPISVRRFRNLERRIEKDQSVAAQYTEVLNEYLTLNHMEVVPREERQNKDAIYLPHHAVVREDKETTKLRVVYDASCKGSNNKSLNDQLLVGPTLQPELRHILMRWRMPPICIVADIIKMYRQVLVDKTDSDFQRIIWRTEVNAEIEHYRLLTVTFGTACAPYLAVKTLQQLAKDEGDDYPMASERIFNDYYMDDLLTGCDTVEEGYKIYKEMNDLLRKGGFELQKWSSNNQELIEKMKGKKDEDLKKGIKVKTDKVIKIVGLTWNRSDDSFRYTVTLPDLEQPITKRKIISDISRFYDPLGWAGPSVIKAKIIIQELWLAGIGWDDSVPDHILNKWLTYREELKTLENVAIPRWMNTSSENCRVELHGFCDASKLAYAAVVYIRVITPDGRISVTLVSAKTKVAPVKQISIPRLELCGAVLLTKLMVEVATVLHLEKDQLYAWTDSTVVLAWLNSHPSRWKVFVANRVSDIITQLDSNRWYHINSDDNPADCASRGMNPKELIDKTIWFTGPEFLCQNIINYNQSHKVDTDLEEVKKVYFAAVEERIFERFSSLTKLKRVVAYCMRFIKNVRESKNNKKTGYLTAKEIQDALKFIIQQYQQEHFKEEITCLKKNRPLPKRSNLRPLNPFFDDEQLLRVGGRLENSLLKANRKHPIILPKLSYLTQLIITDAHTQTLHGGIQLMLSYIQTNYWIPGAKQLVKSHLSKCVICVKNSARTHNPLMGQLPSARVTPSRPFKCSGVDYAGPIQIRTTKGRGHKSYKGYICLFICMATRAVHLEVVSDLTTEGFLQAFKRFVARRGRVVEIWSDNGTNFVGADRELKMLVKEEISSILPEVAEVLANQGCEWHFIPPLSPNFGGLWEAGVKSVKHHLKRTIGASTLTFEEMTTLLSEVEACLNSRPISATMDSDFAEVLTPGHFIIGEPLLTAPDRNYEAHSVGTLRRWQHTQRMLRIFWKQWSQDYLNQFFRRYKWSTQTPQPKEGDIVVIKEDGLPPCRWLYGVVHDLHPGLDKIVRVVTIKTKNGLLKRPVSKLCFLPLCDSV